MIAVNRCIARNRRRLMMLLGALALICSIMLAHGALGGGHMGMSDGGGMSMDSALTVCLAVAESAAAGLAALALAGALRLARPALRAPGFMTIVLPGHVMAIPAGARAGPELLQVFRR